MTQHYKQFLASRPVQFAFKSILFIILLSNQLVLAQMCSYQQVSKTTVPQGPSLVESGFSSVIDSNSDQLNLDFLSPLVYANVQSVFSRTVTIAITSSTDSTMPSLGGLNAACKRTFSGPIAYSSMTGSQGVESCKVKMSYTQAWDDLMANCNPTLSTFTQNGESWQRVAIQAWIRWRDYDANGQVAFDSNMHWPLTFNMQTTLQQSTDSNTNVTEPYVDKSFSIISSSLEKASSGRVSLMISYQLQTRYPYKPARYGDIITFPLGWSADAKTDAINHLQLDQALAGQSCDTGTPQPGDLCTQSGQIAFSFDSAKQCDPAGRFTFLFKVDCSTYMPGTNSDCSSWGFLSDEGNDNIQTVFYIASGSNLCAMITTDNLVPEQVMPPASVANNYGQNSRVSFKSKLAVPIPYVKLQLKDLNITQDGTDNSWQFYSSFVRLTFANDTDFQFSYDGPYNDTDLTNSFKLLYGQNKTSAITTAADDGQQLSFSAKVTVRFFFDPYGRAPAGRKRGVVADNVVDFRPRRLMYRDTTIGGDDLLLSTDATAQAGFGASVVASDPGQFNNVSTLVSNSFQVTEFSYSRDGVNMTLYISYALSTNYPYLLAEWNDVMNIPSTWSQQAKDAAWIRSQFAIQSQVWSDNPVRSNSTCAHTGIIRIVFPTETLCDPAGTFSLSFNQSCFTGDSGDCLQYGQELSTSLTTFVLGSGVNLCASASETVNTTVIHPFGPEQGTVGVGNQMHLWTSFSHPKTIYAAVIDTVTVTQHGTVNSWTLQSNGVPTADSSRYGWNEVVSYGNDKLSTRLDVYFTPNVGNTKSNYMITLADRGTTVTFDVYMKTRLYFDSVRANADGVSRRLKYREFESRVVTRKTIAARDVKQKVTGPQFQARVAVNVNGNVSVQSASGSTNSLSTGAIAGIVVGGLVVAGSVVGLTVFLIKKQKPQVAHTRPHVRTPSPETSDRSSDESVRIVIDPKNEAHVGDPSTRRHSKY